MQRFFTEHLLHSQQTVTLEPAIAKHAIKVLHYDVGAVFELADPKHRVYQAKVQTTDPLTVEIGPEITKNVELPIAVEVVCGVSKGDKAEWIVQKATELGAAKIGFFNAQWGTARWPAERIAKKWIGLQRSPKMRLSKVIVI